MNEYQCAVSVLCAYGLMGMLLMVVASVVLRQ